MRRLDSTLVLEAWEAAAGRRPTARTLVVLGAACPDRSAHELAALPIGRRDALLLDLHETSFGPHLSGLANCGACAEVLDVDVAIDAVRCTPPAGDDGTAWTSCPGVGAEVTLRCPDSDDLATADGLDDDAARLWILRRTVRATRTGTPIALEELHPTTIAAVVDAMAARDPQADVMLSLVCPACAATTTVLLDIAALVWQRVDAWARRVLADVDVLARAYGWEERAVLALSERRRRAYLELAR